MNWPGYNYLGPGNSLNNGPPVNSVDEVAPEHNIAYSVSESYGDIVHADKLAIEKFHVEYEKTGKIAAKVGEFDLRAKTHVEQSLGRTLYPWNMRKASSSKSKDDSPYGLSKSGKPLNRGHENEDVADQGDQTVNIGDDTVDNMEVQSDQPGTDNSTTAGVSLTFKRSKYMKSWGNKIKFFDTPENRDNKSPTQYTTSLAWLPVELVRFYINKAEYDSLPFNSKVTAVRVKVTPIGSQCCFTTNDTNAAWTNSTHTLFGAHAIGLNRTGFVKANKIKKRANAKPMEIEEVDNIERKDWERLFASHFDDTLVYKCFSALYKLFSCLWNSGSIKIFDFMGIYWPCETTDYQL